ncbi:hypothetical protein [Eubacterium sp.]
MTKSEARKKFIKDLITLVIGIVIGGIIGINAIPGDKAVAFIMFGLFLGGIPLGWKFASHIITAVSLLGIVGKLFISLVLGWIVAPITVIKDIISLIVSAKNDTNYEIDNQE